MITLTDIRKTYRTGNVKVEALRGVTLTLPDTGLVFITGRSGCGKTTLLGLLGGMDVPDSGEMVVDGRRMHDMTEDDLDAYRNTYCGFIFQNYELLENKTVAANVRLALELRGGRDSGETDALLRRLGLADAETGETFALRRINELSGGQKQRVAIARALVKNPRVILADEPSGALDSSTGEELYELLRGLSKEKLIVVVTHDLEAAKKYGDRVIEMKDGSVMRDSAPLVASPVSNAAVFERSRLPLRRIFVEGLAGLTVKRARLAISVMLAVLTFAMFGWSLAAVFADGVTAELRMMADNGITTAIVTNVKNTSTPSYRKLSETQRALIGDFSGDAAEAHMTLVWTDFNYNIGVKASDTGANGYRNALFDYDEYTALAVNDARFSFIELNSETGLQYAGLRPDDRFVNPDLCRVPETCGEIAITDMTADFFMRFGYVETRVNAYGEELSDDNLVIEKISSPDDLIGKTLWRNEVNDNGVWYYPFKIVGVYSTEIDREEVKNTVNEYDATLSFDSYTYSNMFRSGIINSVINCYFIKEGFADEVGSYIANGLAADFPECAELLGGTLTNDVLIEEAPYDADGKLVRFTGDAAADAEFIRSLGYEEDGIEYTAGIIGPYTGFVGDADTQIFWIVRIGAIAIAVLAVFSALLMMNFLNTSLDARKRELGMLRALGARKSEIAAICLTESLFLMLIDLILSCILTAISCALVNAFRFYIPLLYFGLPQVALLFAFCLTVTVLATLVPVLRTVKRKPAEIMRTADR